MSKVQPFGCFGTLGWSQFSLIAALCSEPGPLAGAHAFRIFIFAWLAGQIGDRKNSQGR